MTSHSGSAPDTVPTDPDLAEQANPGHGIPSQDPSASAQQMLSPEEAQREGKSALVGGGVMAGAAAGAAVGAVTAGPVGIFVGGITGGIAGALGGAAAGGAREPADLEEGPAPDAPPKGKES